MVIPARLEPFQATARANRFEIRQKTRRTLIAILGLLCEKLADDLRQRQRDVGVAPVRRDGLARDVAMDQLHVIVRVEQRLRVSIS